MSLQILTLEGLADILAQITVEGVLEAMVLNVNGQLIAHNGVAEKNENTSVIATTAYYLFEKIGQSALRQEELHMISMEIEGNIIAISRMFDFFVCLRAEEHVPLGVLKGKTRVLRECLEQPLSTINVFS